MIKVVVVGKGDLTGKQKDLLRRAVGDFEVVSQITTLQSSKDIPASVDIVVTFLAIPAVIGILNTWQKFSKKPVYLFKIEQVGSFDTPQPELERSCDVKYVKKAGEAVKYVYSKTVSILKNPTMKLEWEEEIK